MAFDKNKITNLLVQQFGRIATEVSESNPPTRILAEAVAEAIQQAFTDATVTGSALVENKQGTIKGKIE